MKHIFILLLVASSITSNSQEITFLPKEQKEISIPDINFEIALINRGFDSGKPDGKVLLSNVENIETLDLAWNEPKISNLSGIEYFKNLKGLFLENNNLSELNVSHNLKLESLACGGNDEISELDLSKNISLKHLYLYDHDAGSCNIQFINLSANINLNTLYFDSYVIEHIDLSLNIKLRELRCKAPWNFSPNRGLKILDISNNILLEKLDCSGNQLKQLDVSHHLKLNYLACPNNQLTELNIDQNIELKNLFCSDNNLKYLNCTKNNRLTDLWCSKNLTKCLAALPITNIYYIENSRCIKAENIPATLSRDCIKK